MENLKFLELPLKFLYLSIVQVIILSENFRDLNMNTELKFQGFKSKLWLQ